MPTFDDWTSIFKGTCPAPKIYGRDQKCYSDAGNAWASNVQWSSEHPYSVYWSSTTEDESANYAWGARLDGGYLSGEQKVDAAQFVWAVRNGY